MLCNRHQTGWPRVTTADDQNIVRAVKKHPRTMVNDFTGNLHRAGVMASQATARRRKIEPITQEANPSSAKQIGRPYWNLQSTEISHKSFGTEFQGLMRPGLMST